MGDFRMKKVENKVIVWSIDDFNTLGLMRELGGSEIDMLFLIKGHAGLAASSKYCKEYVETDSAEAGFNYLLKNYKNETFKPIIIIAGDDIVTYVDQHREALENHFILPLTTQKGYIEKYVDKNTMTALADEIGMLCPKSVRITKESDIDGFQYPCIIKPSHQKPGHYNEFKFKICKNEKALKKTLRFVRPDSEFILQEYIQKENDLLVYGGRMWDGKTVIAGAFVRDRLTGDGSSSHGYFISELPCGAEASEIAEFLERIDYHGLFSVEYGLLNNKAYFFEVNLRNDGTSHYFCQAGANIPLAYVYSSAGLDYSHIPTKVVGRKQYIDEIYDTENILAGKISLKQWKKERKEAVIFKYFDKDDPAPYEYAKKGKIIHILQNIILKHFRLYIVFVLDKLGLRK